MHAYTPCAAWLTAPTRFQELDLSASAFLLDNSVREEDWTRLIHNGMRNRNQYRKVHRGSYPRWRGWGAGDA
jgi:hypothetical protein